MAEKYEIQLGIKFNDAELKDIKNQLNNLTDNTHRIRIDIDNSRLLKQIEHAKKELKGLNDTKGSTKTSLNINTKSVEESLGRVEMALNEIGKSLNALDDKSGIKSLVSSVNQITTVLGKAEDESDSLMKSLSALSKKDFSINLNLKAGNANPVKSMADYGDEVRNNVIPQLEKRVDYFRKALGGYENAKSELTRLMTSKYGAKGADRAANLTNALGDDSSLSKQMNAYKRYLDYMQEIASKKNALLLNDYNFQFPVSPEELITDVKKIQSGTKDVEESFEKLKGVFNTGINAEALTVQLDSVVNKLEEVRASIENLSKGISFNGLTASFNELSSTLNKLIDNYSLVKKNLTGIGDGLGSVSSTPSSTSNNVVNAAQQTGKKIGDAIENSVRQSLDIDDVIDKQVTDIMDKFAISGEKGSDAFDKIKQALVECRRELDLIENGNFDIDEQVFGNSAAIDKVTKAIADQMRAVNNLGDEYVELANYMTRFNDPIKGNKVRLPDVVKQEQGDDYRSNRGSLGIAFNTKEGISFVDFVSDLNHELGDTISLTNGEAAAMDELLRKVDLGRKQRDALNKSKKSLSNTLSTEEILEQNGLGKNEIYDEVMSSVDAINAAEKKLSQAGFENIENNIREISSAIDIAENSIGSLKRTLADLGVNSTGIDLVTKDIQDMGIEVQRVKTEISGDNLKLSITGLKEAEDGVKRVVNEIKTFNIDNPENIKRSITDTLETSVDKQKTEAKEINEAYKEIYNTQKKIGSLEVDLIKTEDIKDAQNIRNEIERLKKSLNSLDADGSYTSKFTDKQKADLKELENQIKFDKTNAEREVEIKLEAKIEKEEIKEVEESFKRLKSLAKDMGQLDIKIAKLEASGSIEEVNDLRKVLDLTEKKFVELGNKTQLTKTQVRELDQVFANTAQEIREFNNELSKKTGEQEKAAGLERLKSITKEIAQLNIDLFKFEDTDNIERAATRLNELENEAAELRAELQKKFNITSFDEIDDIARKGVEVLEKLANKAAEVKAKLAKEIKLDVEAGNYDNQVSQMYEKFNKLSGASKELRESVEQVENAYREMELAIQGTGDEVADRERLIQAEKKYAEYLEKTNNLIRIQAREEKINNERLKLIDDRQVFQSKIDTWLTKNSAATKQFGAAMLKLKAQAENCDRVTLNHLLSQFTKLDSAADKAGLKMESFVDRIKGKFKEYSAYFSAAEMFMYIEQGLRDMFEQVKAIDTAMTELKKVTNETDASYDRFLSNAASRAKEIGTTIDGLVTSTADFARLGYEFKDAQGLAEVANIYAVVGDEIEGVEGATESLISTLAAFKSEMNGLSDSDFALSIVDKMNEVSNNFAISSGGLGEALQRSASSMQAANNSLDETIALITAANEVTQNPETVGNAFKTISMRIRGAKTELEEAGESTDGMAESTASLRQEIKALSGVDIMLNKNTFKSTYQILDELSQKWESLSDISQASIIELVAGKHRGNVMASLMTNFDTARQALNTSLNSTGSAMAEHEKWSKSLEARLLKLKAAWQGFSQTFMNSDFLKSGIDLLITLVDWLDKLIDNFGLLGTVGLGTAGFGLFKLIKGDAAEAVQTITDVVNAIENFTDIASNAASATSKVTNVIGDTAEAIGDTVEATGDVAEAVGRTTKVAGDGAKAIGSVVEAAGDGAEAMGDLAGAVTKTGGGFKAFIKSPIGVASAIGILVAAIGLAVNAYKNLKEAQSEDRQEAIRTSDEFLDAASTFEQAYIKYSGKTDLTASEEAELESAIKGTVDALGDKSSALQSVVNGSNDYLASLEAIKRAELDATKTAAEKKKIAAEGELKEAAIGWETFDGSEVDIWLGQSMKNLAETDEAVKIAQEVGKSFYKGVGNQVGRGKDLAMTEFTLTLDADADINEIIDYYDMLVEYQGKLEDAELTDTSIYTNVTNAINKMTDSIGVYTDSVYQAVKASYQLGEGIPKTVEEYVAMREAILTDSELDGFSFDKKMSILNGLDSEYGQLFDLTSAEVQARKFVGIIKGYGDGTKDGTNEIGTVETFLNMRTAVNNNECSVGEYLSQFKNINDLTKNWSDAEKEEFNLAFGLDTDAIKEQYDNVYNYLSRNYLDKDLFGKDTQNMSSGQKGAYKIEEQNLRAAAQNKIKEFLNGLTADELAAVVDIKAEIDWENTSIKDIRKQIEDQVKLNEAMNYTIAIDVETESLELLNSALAESVSGVGLSSESIAALKGRYAELASQGYDLSAMFEETSNGIHLNKNAVSEFEQALASNKLSETDKQLNVLKDRYDELTKEIETCTDAGERASLYSEQQTIAQKINDLATLASQYKGLASAYNAWQNAESAGNERDMYESIIEGFETVGDEIKRGWYDDGTIKFLELITGKTDLAGKSASELKEIWNSLDDTIKGTSYSVKDFFTVDKDGNSTNTGAYNFLRAVEELGKNGKLKALEGKNLDDLIKRKGKQIVGFDFNVVGGDKAVAEALGISEEMVQIIQRALDDAGFVVTLDGKYTLLADLKTSAEEANNSLKKLQSEGLKNLKNVDLNFDFNVDTVEGYQEQLEKATAVLDKFRDKNGKLKTDSNGNLVEGAKEALEIAEYYTAAMDKLTEPKFMQIDTSSIEDENIANAVEQIQEIGDLCKEKHLVSLTGDTEDLDKVQNEIDKVAKKIEELDPEIKAQIGIDENWDAKTIADKIEKGEIEIPAELKLDVQMSEDLADMRLMMMHQLGLVSEKEVKLKIGYEVDDSTVDKLIKDGKAEVVLKFIEDNKEWFDTLTEGKKEIIIDLIANGIDLSTLDDDEKQVVINFATKNIDIWNKLSAEEQTIAVKFVSESQGEQWFKNLSEDERTVALKIIASGINLNFLEDEEKVIAIKYINENADLFEGLEDEEKEIAIKYVVTNREEFDKLSDEEKQVVIDLVTDSSALEALEEHGVEIEAFCNIFGVEKVDDLKAKLEGLTDEQILVFTEVLGKVDVEKLKETIDGLDDKTVQAIAEALGKGDVEGLKTTINNLDDKTVQAIAEAFGYSSVKELNGAIDNLNPKTVQAIAEALGITDVDSLKAAIDRLKSKDVTAAANVNGKDDVNSLKSAIDNLKGKTITIWASIKKKASDLWSKLTGGGGVDGTAHVDGTAFSKGSTNKAIIKKSGKAFKQGDWGTKDSGIALGGEEAPELLVRNGKWHLIGEDSAEFFGYKKGDIIFNASQTKEIFEKGKITHGNKRGKALVSGTAFSKGSGGGEEAEVVSYVVGTNKVTGEKYTKDKDDSKDEFEETIDWVETAIERIERDIDNLDREANRTYKSWGERNKALTKQLNAVREEINLQQKAYKKYMEAAAAVGLSSSWINKIKNGAIDIDTITDETLKEKIEDYKKYYEAALKCLDTIEELKDEEYELFTQRFDNIVKKYEGVLDDIEHQKNLIEEYMSQYEGTVLSDYVAHDAKSYQQIANYYQQLIRQEQLSIVELEKEKAELLRELQNWTVGTEAYNELKSKIYDIELQIAQANTSIVDGTNKISQSYKDAFDDIAQNFENMLSVIEHKKNMIEEAVSQSEAQGWLTSKEYYNALIGKEQENIAKLEEEKASLLSKLQEAMEYGHIEKYSNDWYTMVNAIDNVTLSIEQSNTAILEMQQSIQQLDFEVFDLIQDRISAVTEEAEFLIELMSNKKLYDDNGQLTNEGKATMGLHGLSYNILMQQADMARAEAERIKAQLASDPYDMELEERYRDMIALQQDYILAAEDQKNAIVDLVEEGVSLELEALQEKIDLYQDALDSQKDLYDYQKRVEKQTKDIASLQKQLAAYEGDTSEEAKATIQRLKVELEEAESDLEETQYEKYISDQKKLLDALFDNYELLLNQRLDNIDALIEQAIAEINADASLIGSTIYEASSEVGYKISEEMDTIWSAASSTNNAIASYADKLAFNQTSTYGVISGIKTSVDNMVSQLAALAAQKVAEANKSSAVDTPQANAPSKVQKPITQQQIPTTVPSTTKQPATVPSGTIDIKEETPVKKTPTTDQLMGIAASIWVYGNNSGWGNDPIRSGKLTEKFGADIAKQVQSLINKHGPNGDLYNFWINHNKNLDKYKYNAFKSGARNIDETQWAWTQEQGKEFIVRPSDGAILTPVAKGDSVLTAAASNNIWNMANNPSDFIKDNLNLGSTSVPNNSNVQNSYEQHIDSVVFSMPNVKNYEQLLDSMKKDPNFDRLIEAMTLGKLAGKSSLAKGKAIR